VELDGNVDRRGERRDQLFRAEGREDARHVLDAEGVDAEIDLLLRHLDKRVDRVIGTDRIADRSLGVAAVLLDGIDGVFEIARVVEGVENPEDVDAVIARERHETVEQIVGVIPVPDDILSAEEHLERRLARPGLDHAEAFPGILPQETKANIEGRPAPYFQGIIPCGINDVDDLHDVVGPHSRRPERLVGVTERGVGDSERYSSFLLRFCSLFRFHYTVPSDGPVGRIVSAFPCTI